MENLKLDRPLVALDLETTGTDVVNDRIVQIGLVRVEPSGERSTYDKLVNPGGPIPPGATRVHGITDLDVADAPSFTTICHEVERVLDGADLVGFNSIHFDVPLLEEELRRAGSEFDLRQGRHFDAMRIFHRMEPRTLPAALQFYCGRELTDAHTALSDAAASLEILDAQVGRYDEVPTEPDALHRFCNPDEGKYVDRARKFVWNDDGEAVFTFGKVKDRTLREVTDDSSGRGYLQWMLNKDFTEETKSIVRDALDGVYPTRVGVAGEESLGDESSAAADDRPSSSTDDRPAKPAAGRANDGEPGLF